MRGIISGTMIVHLHLGQLTSIYTLYVLLDAKWPLDLSNDKDNICVTNIIDPLHEG